MSYTQTMSPLSRRDFLRLSALTAAGATLAGCSLVPEVVRETVEAPAQQAVDITSTPVPPTVPSPPQPAKVVLFGVGTGEYSDDELNTFLAQARYVSEVERVEGDATRLGAMWAAGTPPDVWRGSGADVPANAMNEWPLNLAEYFGASEVLKPDDMAPAVAYFQYQDGWYGMHEDFSPDMSLQINVAAFEEAGVPVPEERVYTYRDAADWARALTKREGGRTVRIGWADNGYWDGILQTVLMENGEDIFVDSFTKANIRDNQTVRDVLTFYANLAQENVIWSPPNPSPSWAGDDYVAGRAAIIRYGYWMHSIVAGTAPENLPAPIEKLQMRPGLSWGGARAVNPSLGGAGWFVARVTQTPASAWELFEYYMGGPPAENRARGGRGVPALKHLFPLMPQETELDKQWYSDVMWELENTEQKPRQINPFMATDSINSAWAFNLELYLKGEVTLDQAITNTDRQVNDALRERINAM